MSHPGAQVDRTERFYLIDQLLTTNRVVPFSLFSQKLQVSRATIKRDLEYLRNRLNAPIVWDRNAGGYRFGKAEQHGGQYELPGMWFRASEVHALLTMQHLLASLDSGGLLGPHIQPLTARLSALIDGVDTDVSQIRKRVRILGLAARRFELEHFEKLGSALLRRRRLHISYYVRARDEVTERDVSPQRLVHYRENWYLDAWCHWRGALRSFSVDAIQNAQLLAKPAREIPERTLDAVLGAGYGIFAGRKVTWAKLRFTPERARWVRQESWHPKQKSRTDAQGQYILELPYSDPRELVMDILKHGTEVEVLAPESLRVEVACQLRQALDIYTSIPRSQKTNNASS